MERKDNKMERKKRKRDAEKILHYITWLYMYHFALIKNVVLRHYQITIRVLLPI